MKSAPAIPVRQQEGTVRVKISRRSILAHWPLRRDNWPDVFFKGKWFAPVYPFHRFMHPAVSKGKRQWVTVTLENRYTRIVVLPELGGHVWQMYDKLSGRQLLYANDAIKPTHIGFRNGWCSIGMEFNFPVAHSLLSIDPLPFRIERGDDGSASVITWHRDKPTGLEMFLRLTLRPDRRDLQVIAEMYNPTPVRKPYDYWTNAAIPARDDTEYIFPTRWMRVHGVPKIYEWPIIDGDDLRYHRNYRRTVSLFTWDASPGFFACWWPKWQVGLAHVGDPKVTPGKKLFDWGTRAMAWIDAVTEKAGPYAEIQSGRFPYQADYHWLQPGQVDVLEESWYGFWRLGGLTWAGEDLAFHLQTDADASDGTKAASEVLIRIHPVRDLGNCLVQIAADGKTAFTRSTDLSAEQPAEIVARLSRPARQHLTVRILDREGNALAEHTVSLRRTRLGRKPKVEHEKVTMMFASLDDLDAKGRARIGRIAELQSFWPRAKEAYSAALRADPACSEALCGMANLAMRDADWSTAIRYARKLIEHGSPAWQQTGAYLAGLGELNRGRPTKALETLKTAHKHRTLGAMARLLSAVALARLGRSAEALATLQSVPEPTRRLPIVRWLAAALRNDPAAADFTDGWTVPDKTQMTDLALERALWALRIDRPDLAETILNRLQAAVGDCAEPLVWYLLAYAQDRQGRKHDAASNLKKAASTGVANGLMPADPLWADVLHWAASANGKDPKPHLYLGPMEYWLGKQSEAIEHWRRAVRNNGTGDSATLYSLAMAYWEAREEPSRAMRTLTDAIKRHPTEVRLYHVLDDLLNETRNETARGRWLRIAMQRAGKSDILVERYAHWLINNRRFEQAIEALRNHKFKPAHGWWIRRRLWLLANHLLAEEKLRAGKLAEAYELGIAGANPPTNLAEDDMAMPFAAPALVNAAEALERMGKPAEARKLYEEAIERCKRGHLHPPYSEVYRAVALIRLGKKRQAQPLLDVATKDVKPRLSDRRPWVDRGHFHYIYALILQAQDQHAEARKHFAIAKRLGVRWANLVGFGITWGFN